LMIERSWRNQEPILQAWFTAVIFCSTFDKTCFILFFTINEKIIFWWQSCIKM
jgi:hypothetical protein